MASLIIPKTPCNFTETLKFTENYHLMMIHQEPFKNKIPFPSVQVIHIPCYHGLRKLINTYSPLDSPTPNITVPKSLSTNKRRRADVGLQAKVTASHSQLERRVGLQAHGGCFLYSSWKNFSFSTVSHFLAHFFECLVFLVF